MNKIKKKTEASKLQRVYIRNKRAFYDFKIGERFEAGIVLTGQEVRSVKRGQASLADSFVRVRENEATLVNAYIAPYQQANTKGYDPRQSCRLLLNKGELMALVGKTAGTNLVVVPTAIYVKHGFVKVELALARGKRQFEKREELRRRDINRATEQQLRGKA